MTFFRISFAILFVITCSNFSAQAAFDELNPIQEIKPSVLAFEQKQCPICYDEFTVDAETVIIILGCQHAFCKRCIEEDLKYQSLCPLCKQDSSHQKAYCRLSMQGQDKILLHSDHVINRIFKDFFSESFQVARLFFQSFIIDFQCVAEQHDDFEIHRGNSQLPWWVQNDNAYHE